MLCCLVIDDSCSLCPVSVLAPEIPSGHLYGSALAANAHDYAVSSKNPSDIALGYGKVHLFDHSGTHYQTLSSEIANNSEGFGSSVALSNDFLFVGAVANNGRGCVYVYEKQGGQWIFFQKLTDPSGNFLDFFGLSMEMNGGDLFVHAFADEPDGYPSNFDCGSVSVFQFDGNLWNFTQKLIDPEYNRIGQAMKNEGDLLILDSYLSAPNQNVFMYYRKVDSVWEL